MNATFPNLVPLLLFASFYIVTFAHSPPQLNPTDLKEQLIVRPGDNVVLECPLRSSKDVMFEWYKDNESIMTYGGQRLRILANGSLRIKETDFYDTGVYRCRAVNGFGSVEFNTTLLVLGSDEDYEQFGDFYDTDEIETDDTKISLTAKPTLLYYTKEESPIHRDPGSSFRLQCVANGYPKPEMMWYKNGAPVSRVFRFGRWALKFTKAISTDSGNYTCEAKNLVGSASHSWNLIVEDRSLVNKGRPLLTGTNTTVREGDNAVLECGVKSDSFPHIEWLKQIDPEDRDMTRNGTPIRTIEMEGEFYNVMTTRYTMDYLLKDGVYYHKLVIKNTQAEDAGKYVCLGANSYGFEYRFSYLQVISKNPTKYSSSLPFPIVVTATVVAIAILGSLLAVIMYCCPKHRTGSRGSSTATTTLSKEDCIPMNPGPLVKTKCKAMQCNGRRNHQITTYTAGHMNGMV